MPLETGIVPGVGRPFLLTAMSIALVSVASAATLNVTDFGALPDDAALDNGAIQDAIDTASDGDTILLPAGRYLIDGAVSVHTGITFKGVGQGATIVEYIGSAGGSMVSIWDSSDVEVCDLTLDGGDSSSLGAGIEAGRCSELKIRRLTVRDISTASGWGPHGVLFAEDVTDSEISDSTVSNLGTASEWGAGIRLAWRSARNQVLRNTISSTGRGGILCNDDSTDLVIQQNTVSASGGEGLGIEVWGGCHRSLIEDNAIDHWLSVDASNETAVRRNTVSDTSGIYKAMGLELVGADNCVFADNLVDDGAAIGISVSGAQPKNYVFWGHNTIRRANTWGVQLQGETGGAAYHYFLANSFLETPKDHPEAWYADQGHGFRFNGDCDYVTLDGNHISGNEGAGVQFSGSSLEHLSFVGNTVSDNLGPSVTADPGSAHLEWEDNIVSGNSEDTQLSSRGFTNQKPIASFLCPSDVKTGQTVTFANASFDPDGNIGHVLWDLDDGIPATTSDATRVYDRPGSYRVTLAVWDDQGRGAISQKTVTVDDGAPKGCGGCSGAGVADGRLLQVLAMILSLLYAVRRTPASGKRVSGGG